MGGWTRSRWHRDCLLWRPMETLIYDIRQAARRLRRTPGFTFAAVLTLGLGVGATTATFSVVHGVLGRPLPFPESERLVRLETVSTARPDGTDLSPPNFMSLRERARSFEGVAAHLANSYTLTGTGSPRQVEGAIVSEGFFEVLGVPPLLGRSIAKEDATPGAQRVTIIGHGLWQQAFGGDEAAVGRSVILDGEPHRIVGVMPPGFSFPEHRELWVPLTLDGNFSATAVDGRKSNSWVPAIARLRPDSDLEAANRELANVAAALEQDYPASNQGVLFAASSLHGDIVGATRTPLLLLLGAVALVLLVACANIAGLLIARASGRRAEFAIRAALGARGGRLAQLLFAESALLACTGGVAGLVLATWGTAALVALSPHELPRMDEIRMDEVVALFAVAVTAGTVLLVGVAPAVRSARAASVRGLHGGGRGGVTSRETARFRAALVVAEVSLAVVLLVGAGLLIRSLSRLAAADPGFRSEQVLTFRLDLPESAYPSDERVAASYDELLARIQAIPGVRSAGATFRLPLASGNITSRFRLEGEAGLAPGEMEPSIGVRSVTPSYFASMGIPLRRGRMLRSEDGAEGVGVALVNEAAVRRYFGGEDPVGRRFEWFSWNPLEGRSWTIVGVVGDVRHEGLAEEPEPEAYFPSGQLARRSMTVVVRADGPPESVSSGVAAAVRAMDDDLPPPEFRTMEQVLSDATAQPRFLATILGIFAAAALLLAGVGLYALLSQSVGQRTREIGIRMALGASSGEVLLMVVKRALALAAAGLVVGLAGSLALSRVLRSVLYEVTTTDAVALAGAVAGLAITALIASVIPARRASRVDPAESLRAD